jgi:CubicO group peptidase (beta-lactamase class C family)
MESRLPENDSRPLPADSTKKYVAECLRFSESDMMKSVTAFFTFLVAAAACAVAVASAPGERPTYFPGEQWERLSPDQAAAAGWSVEKLADAKAYATTVDTAAVMIVVGGRVLDAWGPLERKFKAHSIRKSLLGALYGIRVAEGLVDLDATLEQLGVDDNEPSLDEREKTATVRQLLQSRSGVYHPALYETARMRELRPERGSHAPGEFWYYNNWDFNALGTIYENATGSRIHEDFHRLVAVPLGMQDFEPGDGEYVTGEDSIHPAYPFRISARDLARFGLLFLSKGRWGEREVVPAAWVEESLTPWSKIGARGAYGYLWWLEDAGRHYPGVTLPKGSYTARGHRGHVLLVAPALDLVLVHRVDTDDPSDRVEASEFGELLRLVLDAFDPAAALAPGWEDEGAFAPPELAEAERVLPLLMTRHRVPGAALLVIRNRQIAWECYLGVREAGSEIPVDERTVFEAASMTKPIAAHVALKLVDEGRLGLDAPLAGYFETLYLEDQPEHVKITARMVLQHSGGFPNWRPQGGSLTVLHEPGTRYRYSGEGFLYLQRAMERITGQDYETLARERLLGPLGMEHSSHVWRDEEYPGSAAAGHGGDGAVKENRRLYTRANAAYSLYTTARDYAAFVLEAMRMGEGDAHSLSPATRDVMLRPSGPPTGSEPMERRGRRGGDEPCYGLGWLVETLPSGARRVRHSGSNGTGFRSYVEFDPEAGHGLLVFANGVGGTGLRQDAVRLFGIP